MVKESYSTASVKVFTLTTWSVALQRLTHIPILKQVSYLRLKSTLESRNSMHEHVSRDRFSDTRPLGQGRAPDVLSSVWVSAVDIWCSADVRRHANEEPSSSVRTRWGLGGIGCPTTAHCWSRVHSPWSRYTNKLSCLTLSRCDLTLFKHCIWRLHAEHMESHKRHFLLYNLSGICRPAVKTSVLLRDPVPWSPKGLSFSFIFLL